MSDAEDIMGQMLIRQSFLTICIITCVNIMQPLIYVHPLHTGVIHAS